MWDIWTETAIEKEFNQLKTFEELLNDMDNPDSLYDNTTIDEDTKKQIFNWYFDRKVFDNVKFPRYFNRLIVSLNWQYENLLRNETTIIDPLVTSYSESQILSKGNNTVNGNIKSTGRNKTDNTGKGTYYSDVNNTSDSETNTDTESNTTDSSSSATTSATTGNTQSINAQKPYVLDNNIQKGNFPALDWRFASSQDENYDFNNQQSNTTNKGESATNSNTNSKTNSTSDTSVTGGQNNTASTIGENQNTQTNNTSANTSGDIRQRSTGRGESAQDLLTRANKYVKNTNAFIWLRDQLEVCFLQLWDFE